ncbi:Zinc finger, C2H2 type [Popillia japonica]|uniref:Zinc finger, C2H2 type n=1 Tax=Popillia japonica TaxID=7064 RepID=A0AAW1IV53_POPJA
MKFDVICRICLVEKSGLKPIFNACVPNMIMSLAAVQVIQGDGLPNQICTQCLQIVNRSFTFKQQCEKSDNVLRQYLDSLNMHISLDNSQSIISDVKNDTLFVSNEVLQQSSIFNDIFNDEQTHSLVDSFTVQNADLAETMQSLRTIAEQCLPETWDNEQNLINAHENSENNSCPQFTLDQLYKCQFCEESFKDEWSLGVHIKIHTGQAKYYCGICGKECNTPAALNKHIAVHGVERNDKRKNVCNLCGKECIDLKCLKKHYKEDHFEQSNLFEKRYSCNICGKSYKYSKLLTIHMRSHSGERPLSCEMCGKTFSLPSSLHKHRLIHSSEKIHKCALCGKTFNQSSNLAVHIRTHTGEKPYVCNICGKKCVSNVNLKVHLRTHSGEKPFHCMKCESSFATKGQLRKHNLRHTGELPYKCWHCGKAFRQKDTCDTHMRYHTGERPYLCTLCPKKYIAASHLRVHMRTHTGEKKYQCNICTKAFTEHKTLKSHVLTHTGQRPYSWQYCMIDKVSILIVERVFLIFNCGNACFFI